MSSKNRLSKAKVLLEDSGSAPIVAPTPNNRFRQPHSTDQFEKPL